MEMVPAITEMVKPRGKGGARLYLKQILFSERNQGSVRQLSLGLRTRTVSIVVEKMVVARNQGHFECYCDSAQRRLC